MAEYPDFSGGTKLTGNYGFLMPGDKDRQDQIPFNQNFYQIDAELHRLSENLDLKTENTELKNKITTIDTNINNVNKRVDDTNAVVSSNKEAQDAINKVYAEDIDANEKSIAAINKYTINSYLINTNPVLNYSDVGAVGMPTGVASQRISSWALAANKPTYKYSEIQELPTIPSTLSELEDNVGYLKTVDAESTYYTIDNANLFSQQTNNEITTIKNTYALKSEIPTDYTTMAAVEAKGYLTSYTETDPTVPAWAKASTKPSYNFSEIIDTTSGNSLLTVIADLQSKIQGLENRIIELEGGNEA